MPAHSSLFVCLFSYVKTEIHVFFFSLSFAKHTLVKMTILSILDYDDVIHRSAIGFVTGAPFNTHHCKLYSLINWPSLHSHRLIHWYQFIYKTIIGQIPSYL